MKKLLHLLKTHVFAIIIVLVALFISYQNYTPDTFLTGWDTLHPEFNYKIYLGRILDGVWQEHQGLGAVASQAHAAELPRILILLILDIFLKMSQIRYAYAFLMLILGPLGVYFFIRDVILKKRLPPAKSLGAFAGGLFYLLNLGTLQHFYAPLEMFLTHYGLLGWVFLYACKYFENGSKKDLLIFSIVSLFIAPQAHTATLFYAFFGVFVLFFGFLSLSQSSGFKRSSVLILVTLLINAFWFLPNIYFVVNHGREIQQSKIHALFSEEAFLQNKKFGNMRDVAVLKNFLFNWGEYVGNNSYGDLLDEWENHLNMGVNQEVGYAIFIIICIGALTALISKNKYSIPVALITITSIFFLLNVNPPFGFIFKFLQEHVPLFKEAIRFPFTKFSIILMLSYGVFFGYFFGNIGTLIERVKWGKVPLYTFFVGVVAFLLVDYMLPAFNGYLVSPSMRVTIPARYFDLFEYFENQPDQGRIVKFPMHSLWGWAYHDWGQGSTGDMGYQGAGFMWFGVKQPTLDREFDRWNLKNEQYYREMSTAVYSQNPGLFESYLQKYNVNWILVDESIVHPGSDGTVLFYDQIGALLEESPRITLEKDFGQGLVVYKVSMGEESTEFSYAGPEFFKDSTDYIYRRESNYALSEENNYPFVGILEIDESISSGIVTSDETGISFKPPDSLDLSHENVPIVFDLSLVNLDTVWNIVFKRGSWVQHVPLEDFNFNGNTFISISERVFPVVNTESSEIELGSLYVSMGEELDIATYTPIYSRGYGSSEYTVLEDCSTPGSGATYTLVRGLNDFKLFGNNIRSCVTTRLLDLYPELYDLTLGRGEILISVDLGYESLGSQPDFCLFDSTSGLCWDKGLHYADNSLLSYSAVDSALMEDLYMRFFADARDVSGEVGVIYKNTEVEVYTKVPHTGYTVESPMKEILAEDFYFEKDSEYSGNVTELVHYPNPCSSLHVLVEGVSVENVDNAYYRYRAQEQSVCDSFVFPSAPHSTGYVLEVRSRNIQGLPLRVCLTNELSKRCDLYVSLHRSSEFKTQYYLVPPVGSGSGYTLNTSNLVLGDTAAINDLEYLSLTPVNYNGLVGLHSPLDMPTNEELLVFGQAYEKNWVAFCGLKPCNANHVMVNNWANGWVFEEGASTDNFRVFFWPQLLEYMGFVAMLGVIPLIRKS
ncbi:hypothetical protein OAL67_00195 [bacterium]|nr:hypothetical protein [bacterium]